MYSARILTAGNILEVLENEREVNIGCKFGKILYWSGYHKDFLTALQALFRRIRAEEGYYV